MSSIALAHEAIDKALYAAAAFLAGVGSNDNVVAKLKTALEIADSLWPKVHLEFAKVSPNLAHVGNWPYASFHEGALQLAGEVFQGHDGLREFLPEFDEHELHQWLVKEYSLVVAAHDTKDDKLKKAKTKRRPLNTEAADCIRRYRESRRDGVNSPMIDVVRDYVEEVGKGSVESIMRTLNDHSDQWKDDKDPT